MQIKRRKTRSVRIGSVTIGAGHPIAVQSMTKTKTSDVEATVRQINDLAGAGCEIIRCAVKDTADAQAIRAIKKHIHIPLVADIHFDWRLAISAIESGADKIRLNPGNISKRQDLCKVVDALKAARISLRIGVNSGSVKQARSRAKSSMADSLVRSALAYIRMIEKMKFKDIVVSLKASDVLETVQAYRMFSLKSAYPLHLGVTATGTPFSGAIKTSVALGALLLDGIGDTLRVSLTADPKEEVRAGRAILESLRIRSFGPEVISCPTCGRCEIDLANIVRELEDKLCASKHGISTHPLKVAVMGCVVNGPGEASEADIGVAFGKKEGLLFKKGKAIRKVSPKQCADVLVQELNKLTSQER